MDFELRTVLLIIGVVVIAAILIHGLVGIRRANKPIDISHLNLNETDGNGDILRDGGGFDRHGVGVARVRNNEGDEYADSQGSLFAEASVNEAIDDVTVTSKQKAQAKEELQLDLDLPSQEAGQQPESVMGDQVGVAPESGATGINFDVALEDENKQESVSYPSNEEGAEQRVEEPELSSSSTEDSPVFASPIVQEKQVTRTAKWDKLPADDVVKATDSSPEVSPLTEVDVDAQDSPAQVSVAPAAEPLDVLVLNVVAPDGGELSGAILLPTLLTLGFKFGEMDIFHRHVKATGQGDVLFSLVNMMKPGTFDVDNMEQFSTTGVSLFMTIPHQHGNMETFNIMLNAAAKIAEAFDAQVLDGDRSTLTKQSTQHYVQRIRDVERKMLLVK